MMSSVDMEMDDIFEEQDDNDLEADMNPGIPDLDIDIPDVSQTQALTQTQDDSEVVAQLRGAAKKKTMKPQPKLDALRLKGDRGLPILPKVFEKVKFKGKGHETEDLKLMMSKLEHWGHRLYPRLPFDELIDRLEKLGSKKEVQTCVKRIRLDMPILDEDFTEPGVEDVPADADGDAQAQGGQVQNAEDLFDELLRQEHDVFGEAMDRGQSPPPSPTYGSRNRVPSSPPSAENSPAPAATVTNTPKAAKTAAATPGSVTETQKERMERNKRMALEKRAKRLGISVEALQQQITPKPKPPEKPNNIRNTSEASHGTPSQDESSLLENEESTISSQSTNQNSALFKKSANQNSTITRDSDKKDSTPSNQSQENGAEEFVLAQPTKTPENDSEVPKLVLDLSEEDTDMQTAEEIMEMLEDETETCEKETNDKQKETGFSEKLKSDICDETAMETDTHTDSQNTEQKSIKASKDTDSALDISEPRTAEICDNEKENIDSDNIDARSEKRNNNPDKDFNEQQDLEETNINTLEIESQSLSILS